MGNLDNKDIISELAARPGTDITARLLLALTALYAAKPRHGEETQRQYVEVALRLMEGVDPTTRDKVADMLRHHRSAPPEICERLGLATPDPTAAAGSNAAVVPTPSHETALAAPEKVTEPAAIAAAFFAASPAERRQLLALLPVDPDAEIPGVPTPEAAERTYAVLDAAALQGRIGEFIREFERRLALPRSLSERIVNDRSGEPMVVVAKAANIPIAVLQRLLLLINPAVGHSVQRVYDLTDFYHEIDRGAAISLLSLWRAAAMGDAAPARATAERRPLLDRSVATLRARFGALAEHADGLRPPTDQESDARPGLRSR